MDDCGKSGASGSSGRARSSRTSSTTRLKIRIGSTEIMDADVPYNPETNADGQTEESSESSGGTLSPEEPDTEAITVSNQPGSSTSRSWSFTPKGCRQDYQRSESVDSEASGESNMVAQPNNSIGFDSDGQVCAFCAYGANVIFGEGVLIRCRPTAGHTFRRTPTRKKIFTVEEWCNCAYDVTVRMRDGKLHDADGKPFPPDIANPFTDAEGRPFGLVDELARVGYLDEPDPSRIVDTDGYVWAHYNCALWSEGVVHQSENTEDPLLYVDRALGTGLSQRCHYCKRFGASLTCRTGRCTKRYHFPCACAAGCFLDPESLRMWCPEHLAQVDTSSSGALCMLCENSGDIADMVFCTACNQHLHTTCAAGDSINERITISPTVRVGWLCPECKACIVCRETKNENKMLMCDVCDKGCHTYCVRPPVTAMPKQFKCERCRVCRDCGIRALTAGPSTRWHLGYTVCDKCYSQRKKGNCCIICDRSCREKLPPNGVRRCSQCRKMIHAQCDPLLEEENNAEFNDPGYVCLVCRRTQQQQDAEVYIMDADSSNSGVSAVASTVGGTSTTSTCQPPPAKLRRVSGDSLTSSAATTPAATPGRTPALDYAATYDDDSWSSITDIDTTSNQMSSGGTSNGQHTQSLGSNHSSYHGSMPGKAPGSKGAKRVPPPSKSVGKGSRVNTGKNVKRTHCRSSGSARQSKQKASQAESKNDDKDDHPTTVVLCSANDKFMLTQDICLACGSIGKNSPLIPCSQCGQCYHTYCAGVERLSMTMASKGWRCLDCTICEGCGKTHDEEKLILCDDCDISYHIYCLTPRLESVPKGAWRCHNCVICTSCGSKEPGKNSQWQQNWTMCGPCYSRRACHICTMCYEIDETIIFCDNCSRWSHSRCDGLVNEDDIENACENGYNCPVCREVSPGNHAGNTFSTGYLSSSMLSNVNSRTSESHSIMDTTGTDAIDDNDSATVDQSRGYFMDGVVITENGLKTVRDALLKIPKKAPTRRPTGQLGKTATSAGHANGTGGQLARLLSHGPASSVGSATPHREDDLQSDLTNGNSGLDINEFLTGETNNPTSGGAQTNITSGMLSLKSEDSDENSTDCFLNQASVLTSGVDSTLPTVGSSPLISAGQAQSAEAGAGSSSTDTSGVQSLSTTSGQPATASKAKPRNRRVMNLGVGGFRARPSRSMPKKNVEGEEASGGPGGNSGNGVGGAAGNKKRRRPKRRLNIEESYPDYLMDAFLGRELMEKDESADSASAGVSSSRGPAASSADNLESEEDNMITNQGTSNATRLLDETDDDETDTASANDLMMFFSPSSRDTGLGGSAIPGTNSSVTGPLPDSGFKVEPHGRGASGHGGELDDLQEYIISDFFTEMPANSEGASDRTAVDQTGLHATAPSSNDDVLGGGETPTGGPSGSSNHSGTVGSSAPNPTGVPAGSSGGGNDLGDIWTAELLTDSESLQVDEKVLEDMISSLRNEDCATAGGPSPSTDGNFELPPTSSLIATTQSVTGSQSAARVSLLTHQVANAAVMAQNAAHLQATQQVPNQHIQTMAHPQMSPGAATAFMHHQTGGHPHGPQAQTIFAPAPGQVPVSSPLASPVLRRAPAVTSGYPPPPPPPYPGQPPPSPQLGQPGTAHYPQGQHTPHVSPVGPGVWSATTHDQAVAAAAAAAAAAANSGQPHPDDPMMSMMIPQPLPVQMPPPVPQSVTGPPNQQSAGAPGTQANNRRINFAKWAEDEKLGNKASTAAVLYSNTHHPELKHKYPEFNDRAKQINKLWRKLSPDDRLQWVNQARENRTNQKANSGSSNSKKKKDSSASTSAASTAQPVSQQTPMPPPPVPMDGRQRPMFTTQTSAPVTTDMMESSQMASGSQQNPDDGFVHSPAKMSPGASVFHRQLSHPAGVLSCSTPTSVAVSEGSGSSTPTVGTPVYPMAPRGSPSAMASPQQQPCNSPLQRPSSCDYQQPSTPQAQVTVTSPYRGTVGPTTPTSSNPTTPQYYLVNQSTPTQQPPLSPFASGRGSSSGRMTPTVYPMATTPVGENMDIEGASSNVAVTSPSGGPPVTPEGNRQRLKEVLAKQTNERMQKRAATGTVPLVSCAGNSPPDDQSPALITTAVTTVVPTGAAVQQSSTPQPQLSPMGGRRSVPATTQLQQHVVWTNQQQQQQQLQAQSQVPVAVSQAITGNLSDAYKVVSPNAASTTTARVQVAAASTWPQRVATMSPQNPTQVPQYRMRSPQPMLQHMVQRVNRPPQVSQSFVHPHSSHSPYVTATGQQQPQAPSQQQTMYHMTSPHMRSIPPNPAVYSQHQQTQTIIQPGLTSVMQPQQIIQQGQQQISQPTIQVVQQVTQVSAPLVAQQPQQHTQHVQSPQVLTPQHLSQQQQILQQQQIQQQQSPQAQPQQASTQQQQIQLQQQQLQQQLQQQSQQAQLQTQQQQVQDQQHVQQMKQLQRQTSQLQTMQVQQSHLSPIQRQQSSPLPKQSQQPQHSQQQQSQQLQLQQLQQLQQSQHLQQLQQQQLQQLQQSPQPHQTQAQQQQSQQLLQHQSPSHQHQQSPLQQRQQSPLQQHQQSPLQQRQQSPLQQPQQSPLQQRQQSPLQQPQQSPLQQRQQSPLQQQRQQSPLQQQPHQSPLQQQPHQSPLQQQPHQSPLQQQLQQSPQPQQRQQSPLQQQPQQSPQSQQVLHQSQSQQKVLQTEPRQVRKAGTPQQSSPSVSTLAVSSPLPQAQGGNAGTARSNFNVDLDASIEEEAEEDSDDIRSSTCTISAAALTGQVQELLSGNPTERNNTQVVRDQESAQNQAPTSGKDTQQSTSPAETGTLTQQQDSSIQKPQAYQHPQQSAKAQVPVQYQQRQMQLQQTQQRQSPIQKTVQQQGENIAVYLSPQPPNYSTPTASDNSAVLPVVVSKASPVPPGNVSGLLDDRQSDTQAIDFEPPVIVSKIPGPVTAKVAITEKDTRVRSVDSRSEASSLKSECAATPPKSNDGLSMSTASEARRETPPARSSDTIRLATSTPDNASKDSECSSRGMDDFRSLEKETESSRSSSTDKRPSEADGGDKPEQSHLDQIIDSVVEESRGWENKNPAERDLMTELRSRERGNSRRSSSTVTTAGTTATGLNISSTVVTAAAPGATNSSTKSSHHPHPHVTVAGHPLVTLPSSHQAAHMSPSVMTSGMTMTTQPRHPLPHGMQASPHPNLTQPSVPHVVSTAPHPSQGPPPHIMQQMHHQQTHVPPHQSIMIVPQSPHTGHHNIRHPTQHTIQMTQHPHGVHTAYADANVSQSGQVTASMGNYPVYSPTHLPPQQSYHNIPMMQMHGAMTQTTAATQHMVTQQAAGHPSHQMQAQQQLETVAVSQSVPMVSTAYLQPTPNVPRDDSLLLKDLVEQEKLEQRQRLAAEQQHQQFKMTVGGATPHHSSMVPPSPVTGELSVSAYTEWGAQQSVPPGSSQEVWLPSSAQGEDDLSSAGP